MSLRRKPVVCINPAIGEALRRFLAIAPLLEFRENAPSIEEHDRHIRRELEKSFIAWKTLPATWQSSTPFRGQHCGDGISILFSADIPD